MKVILLENIKNIGKIGEIVTVKNGFGRNWLLPKEKALRASKENIAQFEANKKKYDALNAERKQKAEKQAISLKEVVIDIVSPAQLNGLLYGSITIKDLFNKFKEKGVNVPKSQINLNKPIKEVGKHAVNIALHPEVSCDVFVYVAGTQEALHSLMNPQKEESEAQPKDVSKKEKAKKDSDESELKAENVES